VSGADTDPAAASTAVVVDHPQEGLAIVRLARPPVNALDLGLIGELADTVEAQVAAGARAVVVTGDGQALCAGLDTKALRSYDAAQQREVVDGLNRMLLALYELPVPTVCAVNGHALAGGLIIALACDLRIVTTADCRLGLTEVRAGVPFPAIPLRIVQEELSPVVVRQLGLTGMTVGPQQALAMGIADELCTPQALVERAVEAAADLMTLPTYPRIKSQVRGEATAAMRAVHERQADPLLDGWL
jgi:enoyl-CoA hydratase